MTHIPHPTPYDSVLGTVGGTPLIRLARAVLYKKSKHFDEGDQGGLPQGFRASGGKK